ncbi:MAG TPA: hypothetical protein VHZ73_05760, partial [Vicinamibacterales bacterium]|nr:hypothetical protein [Vicinamibacterales bacterium]
MRKTFWIVLAITFFVVSGYVTAGGMMGGWNIDVAGITHGAVWDPGGSYLGSSLLLFEQRYSPFIGHPGLTLMLYCHFVAKALYGVSGSGATFQHFAGTAIYRITYASMLAVTALWLAAFAVVEQVALAILRNARMAMLATLAFATTYPTLYYINRISPEPLLVIFTLLAFLWLWRYYELGDSPRAMLFLVLSSQAGAAALYTKAMIVGPVVLFIPFQILFRRGVSGVRRIRDAAIHITSAVPLMVLGAWKVDWAYFFRFWFGYAPGRPQYVESKIWAVNVMNNAVGTTGAMLAATMNTLASGAFLPSFSSREGLFFAAETIFLLIALAGLTMYYRSARNHPALLTWYLGFVALASIPYLQRGLGGWHYLHLQLATASIFFSYGMARMVRRVTNVVPETSAGWLA